MITNELIEMLAHKSEISLKKSHNFKFLVPNSHNFSFLIVSAENEKLTVEWH
jgi:hypothetical protein